MENAWFRRWSLAMWLALALMASLVWVLRFRSALEVGPYVITTGGEENSLLNISLMRHGEPVYVDCYQYPYRSSLFNWLYYFFYGRAAAIAVPSDLALPSFLRCLTVGWTFFGALVSLYFMRVDEPANRNIAGLALAVCVSLVTWFGPMLSWWTMTTRPDVAAVACEFLAFGIVVRSEATWRRMLIAGLLFFVAWSFKQNEVVLLLGLSVGLMLRREWLHLVIIGVVFSVLVAVVFALQSDAYFTNVFDTVRLAPWSLPNAVANFRMGTYTWGFLAWMGLVIAFCCRPAQGEPSIHDRQISLAGITLFVALPLNFLFSARRGAWSNYFFESWLVAMGLTGLIYLNAFRTFESFTEPFRRRFFIAGSTGMVLLALIYTIALFPPVIEFETLHPLGETFDAAAIEAMRSSPRPIFNDHPTLSTVALGPEAGDVPMIDYTIYWDALKAGRFDAGGIGPRIRSRWFATIWLDHTESAWEKEVLAAGYVLKSQFGPHGNLRQYVRP